ncbi:hypothetical protein AYO44_10280 [Planctomycetaceae bacterium SCGC AG-212-F19]|nr:hypothetical protein AYO44_10280 [Planctomycetaceae bacterium SCGC AG-212-F19]
MTHICKFLGAVLACVLVTAVASADPINVAGSTGSWQPMPAPTGSGSGSPFWDSGPTDGGQKNVGNFVSGTGSFLANPVSPSLALSNLNYWATGAGLADPNVYFTTTPPNGPVTTTLRLELAGFSGSNILGYYDSTGDHVLFVGADGAGAVATINAIGAFGLYLISPEGTFRSDPGLYGATSDDSFQHFAIFKELDNNKLWFGVEDLKGGGDKDYNDMLVSLECVPEPASVLSFVIGGLAVGCYGAYRRRQKPANS